MINKHLNYKSVSYLSLCWVDHSCHHLPFVSATTYSINDPIYIWLIVSIFRLVLLLSSMRVQLGSLLLDHDTNWSSLYNVLSSHTTHFELYTTNQGQADLYMMWWSWILVLNKWSHNIVFLFQYLCVCYNRYIGTIYHTRTHHQ